MNSISSQKLLRLLALVSFGLSVLFVIFARVYTVSCSNIVLMYTAWPEIIEILVNLVECTLFGFAYAILIYAVYRFPERKLTPFISIYFASVSFKYISNYLLTWITDTGMSAEYLLQNLLYIFIFTAIELLQAALVLLIVHSTMNRYHVFVKKQQRIAANLPGTEISVRTYAFPFTALFSLKNPLQKCALWSGIFIAAFKMASRLIYDFSYGLPTSVIDALWMVIYYLLDIFIGVAVCLFITYLLMAIDHRDQVTAVQ